MECGLKLTVEILVARQWLTSTDSMETVTVEPPIRDPLK